MKKEIINITAIIFVLSVILVVISVICVIWGINPTKIEGFSLKVCYTAIITGIFSGLGLLNAT